MIQNQDNAANSLLGMTLKGGWKVVEKVDAKENSTGGFFSVCYIVKRENEVAFLKALNFLAFFQMFRGQKSVVEILSEQTSAFKFEKELLLRCKNNHLSKVSLILDEGEEFLDGFTIPDVPYLIFELAEGDVRNHMNFIKDVEIAWKLRSLHNVAVGLKQLHSVDIGHQDLKPSNVLIYQSGLTSKIGDLGRSLCTDIQAPHENGTEFTGDFSYAPPEFLYKYIEADWSKRLNATDMYLFGSLIVFYFSGANMTALIGKNIDRQFLWTEWKGSFEDVKTYLVNGFYKALKEFGNTISNEKLSKELSEIVEYCCFPIPEQRGHSKSRAISLNKIGEFREGFNQYNFERIVSKFDLLSKQAKYLFN